MARKSILPQVQLPKVEFSHAVQAMSEVYDWGLRDLNIPEMHKLTYGEGIKIAVIDSGKPTHFDVKNNISAAENFTDSNTVEDKVSHSTFVSGIIAAEVNAQGIIGVAPKSKIHIGKALDDGGVGSPVALAKSIAWAIDEQVDIISISAGLFFDFKPIHKQIKRAYGQNIITVAAVGNTGDRHANVAFPARYNEVIGVGAYNKDRVAAPFSSRGINVSFSMPGVDIYSCGLDDTYMKSSGSSFAAPIMTGICALILSKHRQLENPKTPCETPKQMLEHLKKYSVKLEDENSTGFGTIDLEGILQNA